MKSHETKSAVLKKSFMHVDVRIAVLYLRTSEVRPLCLDTHVTGLKHLLKITREENTNRELITVELEFSMEMSQHELIIKRKNASLR